MTVPSGDSGGVSAVKRSPPARSTKTTGYCGESMRPARVSAT